MIYIGSDHAGFKLKEAIKSYLTKKELIFEDVGNVELDPDDDYPEFGRQVAKKVVINSNNRGILACGSGIGMCLVANKVKGARGFIPISPKHAEMSRRHTNTNIICFGQDYVNNRKALKMLDIWLNTKFDTAARHRRRVSKID